MKIIKILSTWLFDRKRKKCKHQWVSSDSFHRTCHSCGLQQIMVYYRFGSIRTEWIQDPWQLINDDIIFTKN